MKRRGNETEGGEMADAHNLESLVEMADKALYRTKENGKNGINGVRDR